MRKALLPVLGLREDQARWFEILVKPNLEQHAHLAEVRAVRNIIVVHYIEIEGEEAPPEVLASVRGTIIYQLGGKYFVIRKSIPYTQDLVLDSLPSNKGEYVFSVPSGNQVRKISVGEAGLKIVPYIEGTVIDIMKVDGVVQWYTSHNVLPKGVQQGGRNVYKKARWGHHEAFTDDFENIIRVCDPGLLNENDELFPADCITSNKAYRFVLLTRERVRAEAAPISEKGVLIYLGCLTQFQYSDFPELDFGDRTEMEYQPRCESSIPLANRPSIVQFNKSMTVAEANAYLAGPHPELGVLSGGGKLVVQARTRTAGGTEIVTFHIKSSSYAYREQMLGDFADLYQQFLTVLNLGSYDFGDAASLERYYRDFPGVRLPTTREEALALRDLIQEQEPLIPELIRSRAAPATPLTHLWYLFLLCTNVSVREGVMRYLERYAEDVRFLQKWMFSLKPAEGFKARSDDEKDKKKAISDKSFIFTFKLEILRHEMYNKGRGANTVMLLLGDKTMKAISISRRVTGTKMDSIAITEPELRPPASKVKSYATIAETPLVDEGPRTDEMLRRTAREEASDPWD